MIKKVGSLVKADMFAAFTLAIAGRYFPRLVVIQADSVTKVYTAKAKHIILAGAACLAPGTIMLIYLALKGVAFAY